MKKSSIDAGSNVKVICRFRPMIDIELELGGSPEQMYTFPTSDTVIASSGDKFTFDKVFSMSAQQHEIFDFIGKPIIDDVLTGYNGTVLAYGQTGSGKSFSMMGFDIYDTQSQGIIPRAIKLIFESVEKAGSEAEFTLKCSMLEIYKEKLKDLCGFTSDLKIKESKQRGIYVDGLTEIYVVNEEEMLDVLAMGERNRTVASTKMNNASSRSHQLFILEVKQKLPNDSEKRGILNLVDLAGSEKINQTGVTGNKLEEAKKINLSLSALGNVIKSLTSSAEHIPYRDSKLTRLLQESLGGNYKTSLLICCSPHPRNAEDTLNTLKFAQRAKTIKNKVHVNIKKSAEEYIKMIEELKVQLAKAKEECEYWKNKVYVRDPNHNRASTLTDRHSKGLNAPEMTVEDVFDHCSLVSDIGLDELVNNTTSINNEEYVKVKSENEDLKTKVDDLTNKISQESKKRILSEKKYVECFDNYNRIVLELNEKNSKHDYLAEENISLKKQVEMLKTHIKTINIKFNKIFEKMKNGENITEWEYIDTISEKNISLPVYTQEASLSIQEDLNESLIGITTDPEMLIAQDCYAQEISLALEESSQMNQDIIIFELKKQIINSGILNCELFRSYTDLKLRGNLLTEKFNLKAKLIKFQESKIKLYECTLNKLQESYDKLIRLISKYEETHNIDTITESRKAKIARPIRGASVEIREGGFRRMSTIVHGEGYAPMFRRQSTMVNSNEKNMKFKSVESGFQLQVLYNHNLKQELELARNERNTFKSLYSNFQSQHMDIYNKDKLRWKKYLEEFKENCNIELIRKQQEINKLNHQIAHWMNMYIELQDNSDASTVRRIADRKRNYSNVETLMSNKAIQLQLLNSPLHSNQKVNKLSLLNSKRGDISPAIFDD
ncbi:hypothetical protein SteCoe_20486 [Stentor coeruleus]|uniref:Kinesin motor domain-containing protein n=1 Tax=Stentor coeruleus TaxID=5963 RepID=A0A1R2BS46_9CILI|nr:hypothetical protein SteCoe_20486 [Stentor coeruleus]